MDTDERDKRIAELEKKLTTPKWEYTGDAFNAKCYSLISVEESLWLIDQLKVYRQEIAQTFHVPQEQL